MSVPPERGSRFREMVAAARELLETEGPEALTMRRVASRLGIREPSLYKHSRGRDELLAAVVASGMRELAEGRLEAVRPATGVADALARLATHQREFAARHPHLYRLMFDRPFSRELLAAQADARAWRPVVEILGSQERVWAAFAFAHGMLELERTGRLPRGPLLEAVWKVGLDAFEGLSRQPLDEPAAEHELRAHQELLADLEATIMAFRRSHEP
jgi:AcrR family transcriptional regulator